MVDDDGVPNGDESHLLLGVLRGLRVLAEGRFSGLVIAPGEYLADIYCIQRVAALLAMELAAAGQSLRRPTAAAAGDEVHAIEHLLAAALERRGVQLDDCVLDLAAVKVEHRNGGSV
ncbi:MAG: hypothetical protein AB7R89_21290 [Dehalococcoidia bacterium]